MTYRYWLLFGSFALGATQTVACSSEFKSCQTTRTCAPGGAGGVGGTASSGAGGVAAKGGSAGLEVQAGEAGESSGTEGGTGGADDNADDAGSGGMGDDSSVEMVLEIAPPALDTGKTYLPFKGKITASGAQHYNWSITSGALPAGLVLQGVQTATVTIAGTPTQAGQFPITLSVTDGVITKSVDVPLGVTHPVLFLSDRNIAGVNELFLAEIGAASVDAPMQLSATLPAGGGITSYAWSPDGSKVMYIAKQSSGGAAELWVASVDSPGIAQRVSAGGVSVSKIAWLRAGSIASYLTSTGDAYLVDLSGSTPGASKLAVSSPGTPSALTPSPNGVSVMVGTYNYDSNSALYRTTLSYVTWNAAAPKSITIYKDDIAEDHLHLSYDGQFGVAANIVGAKWWDLSLASPAGTDFTNENNPTFSFSPNAQALAFVNLVSSPTPPARLVLGTFAGGTMLTTPLIQPGRCTENTAALQWSPDGKDLLFRCDHDIRGIGDAMRASSTSVGSDFSLLPNDFWSNTFTWAASVDWSPDSKWIAIRADRDVKSQYDLYLVRRSAPGVAYKPHANSVGPGITTWTFAQNSQSVAFVGTVAPQSNAGLYLSKLPASGAPSTAALVSAPANAAVQDDITWLPGSRVITYRAIVAGAAQLYAVPLTADGTAGSALSMSGVSGSGVLSYQLAPAR
ncbi:MAG TPA: hypothetical protein VER96_01340 [Polyangiaceae bacterium]|nr:hypothetical protein [Polyangiaceae bacterium]